MIAGSSNSGEHYLVAFSFDEHFDPVTKVKIKDSSVRGFGKFSSDNVFVVGGVSSVHVYYLNNKVFYRLASIPDVAANMIDMITISKDQCILVLPSGNSKQITSIKLPQKL